MSRKSSNNWLSLPVQEIYLLLFFGGVSAAMFILSFQYPFAASIFPQLTAGIVIVGVLLILFNQILPGPIKTIVMDDSSALQRDEFKTDQDEPKPIGENETAAENEEWGWGDDTVITAILFSGYIFVGYLIGLLWASPIFVYIYARWFDQSRLIRWSLVIIAFLLGLIFYIFLNLPVDSGRIHDWMGVS